MLRRYRAGGIDPLAEKILTYPVLHYQNGGLVIDADAETTLEGVYACGEIAGGTHGRNRMMGNSSARVRRLRPSRRQGRRRESDAHEHRHDNRPAARGGGRRRAPLRLGAEGHPAGPARRAQGRARARDLRAGPARARRRSSATSRSPTASGNLVCQDTGIAVYTCHVGEHFPLHPARIYEALRDGTARATIEHPLRSNAVHTITRENTGPEHRPPPADRALGVRQGLGRARREVRAEGLRLREHELPEDVRPRRRREGDQAVRARVDRRRRRQAVPARDRRRRHRRLGRLRDVPREGGDHAADRHAQRRSARRAARGRADRAS